MERILTVQDVMWLPAAEVWHERMDRRDPFRKVLGDLLRKPGILHMAGSLSNTWSTKLVQGLFGGVAITLPTNEYLGLWTTTPDDTFGGATAGEAAYTSYARTQIGTANDQTTAWNTSTGTTTSTVTNKNAITCPTSTGGTSTIIGIQVLDSATIAAGNGLCWATVSSTTINSGDTPKVNASALSIVQD